MNYQAIRFLLLLLLLPCLIISPSLAKDTHNLVTTRDYSHVSFFYPDNIISQIYHADINPHWIRDDAFWYTDTGKATTMFFLVNTSQNVRQRLLDTDRFTSSLEKTTGKAIDPARLPISNMELAQDGRSIIFDAFDERWRCDLSTYQMKKITLPEDIQSGILSPDGYHIAYVNNTNLWLYDTRTGETAPLTSDGTTDYFYGKRSDTVRYPVTEARLNETPAPYIVWSPDSTKILTYKVDQRNVNQTWLLQNAPDSGIKPILYTYRFANPKDQYIPMYEPIVIDIPSKKITQLQYQPQPEVSMMDTDINQLQWWNKSGEVIYLLFFDRGEKTIRLISGDPETGTVREILQESGETYIESNLEYGDSPNVAILEKTGDIIWFSERDGWGHLYRYDSKGTLKNQITKGTWVVRKIVRVDEDKGLIFFTGSGREPGNPYYQYLYQVQTDGNGLKLLTPGHADHEISLSPDGRYFIDSFSRVDLPTTSVLRTIDGSLMMRLATTDDSELRRIGWTPPERVTVLGRDGTTEIHGLIFKPTDFDEKKKYPVIDVVYPGPYTIVTATAYPADLSWNSKIFWTCQMLSELGYIVVTMDGMGTAYRSKPFHSVSYHNLSDCGLPDHIAGITQLATRYPYMDISRVGMYGKSAGGFMTAQAMLTYPDFFKVGVAASGNHDSRLYGSFWGEKYEGYPVGEYYLKQVTKNKAENLSGKLLLLTGDLDDNVHPAHTMQLADALEKAGKQFEIFIFTGKNHDLNYDPYYLKKMMGFFINNL